MYFIQNEEVEKSMYVFLVFCKIFLIQKIYFCVYNFFLRIFLEIVVYEKYMNMVLLYMLIMIRNNKGFFFYLYIDD